ncbi:MAG TPA: hypothetical protein VJM74_02480 [Nitrososphaeraceae archaeon]|nr:hypothetical protein [Nitrososphaeraceae archaeon]
MSEKISFEEAFAQSTSESIKILGDIVSKIVTDFLEAKYSISLTKTANNPAALDEALDHAIDGGKIIIERKLLNLLYKKLNLEPIPLTISNLSSFEQKVNEAKNRYHQ